jgi:hypothetical protein
MASSINASTSGAGGLITTADNTGILQLQSGGTTIATVSSTGLALNTGNITLPSGAAPAFSAYANASQTIATATATKIAFQTEVFDTNNNFDSTTNYRFTPTIAGYYQFNASLYWNATLSGEIIVFLYKNGAAYVRLFDAQFGGATAQSYTSAGTNLAYANGSTDYFEIYGYQSSGSSKSTGNQSTGDTIGPTYFQGFLARSA